MRWVAVALPRAAASRMDGSLDRPPSKSAHQQSPAPVTGATRRLVVGPAPVDEEGLPGDEVAVLAGQKRERPDQVLG